MTDVVRLVWEGKRAAVAPEPLHLVRASATPDSEPNAWLNKLIEGDNLGVMAALQAEIPGQFALIYFDPPFFTRKEWHIRSHSSPDTGGLLDEEDGQNPGDQGAIGTGSRHGFSDDWAGGLSAFLQWLYDRLAAAHALLAEDGCLYLHLSWHSVHYAKLLLDEIFGTERFQNEIVWCYREAINSKKRWNRKHDTILFYSRGDRFTFNYDAVREPYSVSTLKKFRSHDDKGPYRLMGRGITNSPLRSKRDLPPQMESLFPDLTYRHYLGEGTLPVDYWQIDIENQASNSRTGYPTQKPEALMERILLASTNPGDLVGDFCCGSGTTLAVAERLGRRWIGCDSGDTAIRLTRSRLAAQGAAFEELTAES